MADSVMPRDDLYEFWRNPDADNQPRDYLVGAERTEFLVELARRFIRKEWRVLEIGCNVGRNLHGLKDAGYRNLGGVEINPTAVEILRETWPDLAGTPVIIAPIEDVIRDFRDNHYDLVFTMAVLEHLHPESEWVFAEMSRISGRAILTIEDEAGETNRHQPRNYGMVFGSLGLREVLTQDCSAIEGLGPDFRARLFVK